MPGVLKNIVNKEFGFIFVLSFNGYVNNKFGTNKRSTWKCLCLKCGKIFIAKARDLKSNDTQSCGCYRKEVVGNLFSVHRMHGTPEYNSWLGMKSRCYNKSTKCYKYYGGRGITVCDRWRFSFENFYVDMGEKPEPKKLYSIHRINDHLVYCEEHCKWATWDEQALDRRKPNGLHN